jgi:Cell wall-active antibiotics response 4TMS YvqF
MMRWRSLLSMLLVGVGAVLLVDELGGLDKARVLLIDWWPLLVIAVGLVKLGRSTSRPWAVWGPLFVVLVGVGLLLWRLEAIPPTVADLLLPVLLLALGPVIAFAGTPEDDTGQGWVRQRAVLGRKQYVSTADSFRYGKFSAWFGHLELDLRQAHCHDNGADLVLTAVCGHVHVSVPDEWRIEVRPSVGVGARSGKLLRRQGDGDSARSRERISVHRLEVLGRAKLTPS